LAALLLVVQAAFIPAASLPASAAIQPSAVTRPTADFDPSFYYTIDVARAARDQYGPGATVAALYDHLFGWRAVVNGQYMSLDLHAAVARQFGRTWSLVAIGVGLYDWRAVRFPSMQNLVLPVMLVSSDLFFDVAGVANGVARFRSVLTTVQNWYRARTGGSSFRMLQPLVLYTSQTSSQWNALSDITADPAHRWDLINAARAAYAAQLPGPGSARKMVLSMYTGESQNVWLGAASGENYAVVPPRATSLTCPERGTLDPLCADAAYAIGHELGHTFGLAHSCDTYPNYGNCQYSIMQTGKPWDAILLPPEITRLLQTPFFGY
jgi:hypothetical protein